jgi:hypothetical protein
MRVRVRGFNPGLFRPFDAGVAAKETESMKSRSFSVALVLGAVIASSSSCGGGKGSSSPSGVTTPTPTPQTVHTDLGATSFDVRNGVVVSTNVDFPPVGMLAITTDWSSPSNSLLVYATDQSCPGFQSVQSGACQVLAKADSPGVKPQKLSFQTASGKIYTIWVNNTGRTVESVNMSFAIDTLGPIPSPVAPTPAPSSTPGAPRASPTPPDMAPGPVTQVKAYIKSIDTGGFNYRPAEQGQDGNWKVHPGEFVVFDMTQRNGAGLICNWIVDPVWTLDDPDGILLLKESSSPFFLRTVVEHKGHFEMFGTIDDIRSNLLTVDSVPNGN